ncbi:MAG: hypothetical protein ACUVV4_03450 [Candidatus Bathyarchaeia archaeon]
MRCYLCYAQAYAYLGSSSSRKVIPVSLEECSNTLKSFKGKVGWGRIQGGEPLINKEEAFATAKLAVVALKRIIDNECPYRTPRVVVQTNGLWFATADENEISDFIRTITRALKNMKGGVAIEVSFKGPNPQDANSYALSKTDTQVSDVFNLQANGFKKLVKVAEETAWQDGVYALSVYPIAGLGVDIENPGFIPISTLAVKGEEYPLFHPETWDDNFRSIIKRFTGLLTKIRQLYGDYVLQHGTKIPLEGMDASFFQFGWISQIRKRPELKDFVKRYLRADWNNSQLNIFRLRYRELSEIIPQASNKLLRSTKELGNHFYDSKPVKHYPYL